VTDSGPTRENKKNPLGPTGERVRQNVRRLRLQQGLNYAKLSAKLAELGRPIPVLGLSRLEHGDRRADADDLAALAVALDVTPNTLLLPEVEIPFQRDLRYEVTSAGTQARASEIWAWALGERPLGKPPVSLDTDDAAREAEGQFVAHNRRHHGPGIGSWMEAMARGRIADASDRDHDAAMIAATIIQAFQWGRLNTADIRQAVESGFLGVLLGSLDLSDRVMNEAWEWLSEIREGRQKEQQSGAEQASGPEQAGD
jgi:transcriptional regulator with XRE-family HTH domain